jgi:hypothetical protein
MQRAAYRNHGHWEVHVAASALVQWTIVGIVIALVYKRAMATSREGFEQDSEYLRIADELGKSERQVQSDMVALKTAGLICHEISYTIAYRRWKFWR